MNRPSDAVEAILCLAANAWTLLIPGTTSYSNATVSFGDDLVDDPQRAVVERRIAPHQKGTAFPVSELLLDQPLVYGNSARAMPTAPAS